MQVTKRSILIFGTLLLGCLCVAYAQQDFQIKTRVDLVVVPVSVRDSNGRLVAGLKQEDFVVREDGKPQTISNFSADPQPLSAAIVVDDGMDGLSLRRLSPLFISVTNGFGEMDEMTAFRFDHLVTNLTDFTNDPILIEKSFDVVKKIAVDKPAARPTTNSVFFPAGPMPGPFGGTNPATTTTPPTPGPRPIATSRVLHDAIYEAAKALESRPKDRRKIIFIISDGQASGSTHTQKETIDLLLRDQIELFAVWTEFKPFEKLGGTLTAYADATGGNVFSGGSTGSMERGFANITEEARNQYVLGYFSNNEVPRGRPSVFRTIDVRTVNPRLSVTYRRGYTQYP
jgi:VWFA-related protein